MALAFFDASALRVRPTKLVKGHHHFTFTFITSHQSSFALNVREHGLSDHVPKSTSEFQGRHVVRM